MDRVLAFRFTNSLAKLSRALAYLRGNAYVTRKEIMDVLPYVVGHRIGRSKGDGGNMEYGIKDDAGCESIRFRSRVCKRSYRSVVILKEMWILLVPREMGTHRRLVTK